MWKFALFYLLSGLLIEKLERISFMSKSFWINFCLNTMWINWGKKGNVHTYVCLNKSLNWKYGSYKSVYKKREIKIVAIRNTCRPRKEFFFSFKNFLDINNLYVYMYASKGNVILEIFLIYDVYINMWLLRVVVKRFHWHGMDVKDWFIHLCHP